LGTITGMMDTFQALGGQSTAGYSERMALGISKALITTEFGLSLAIPGILVSRALKRREARLLRAVDELEARFSSRATEAQPC
jgi:biopolymer transport protein ExbB